jgi:hypothetical protein
VRPSWEKESDSVSHDRADRSITIYHLDHERLNIARCQLAAQVREAVLRVDVAFLRWRRSQEGVLRAGARDEYKAAIDRVGLYVRRAAPLAGSARSILAQERSSNRPWIDSVLQST